MSLDFDLIRKRLNALKTQTTKSALTWKPPSGKTVVRIVPYKHNPSNPFIELYFHYNLGKKTFLSLKSFGEDDPIVQFCDKLKRTRDKEDWRLARTLEPKMRTFAPIVVRGKEQEGVKFWGFGKTVYEKLLKTIQEPDWGDITDPMTGRDIVVEFKTKEEAGKDFPQTDIVVKPSQIPITKDDELMDRILNEQKEITEVFAKPTYEELLEALDKFSHPEKEGENPEGSAEDNGEESEAPEVTPPATSPAKNTKDVTKAFEELFNEAKEAKTKQ